MRLLLIPSCVAVGFFGCGPVSLLRASPPALAITVTAPRAGTKLTSGTGSTQVYRPLADLRADGLKHPPAFLPAGAAAKRLHGEVRLRVEATRTGEVQRVVLDHSSGSALLDESARSWVLCVWRYPAAEQPKTYREQIRFETTDRDVTREANDVASARAVDPGTPRPPYPASAIYRGWQGTLRLRLIPDGSGGAKQATVIATSHMPLLDLVSEAWCESYWKMSANTATVASITFQLR